MGKTINIVTLGCSKNLVDSEHLAARAAAAGYGIVFDSNSTDARVVVINTCGFIGDAKEESVDTILGFAAAKERGEIDRLYVIGCLSERYADQLSAEMPEVDRFFGARTLDGILAELEAGIAAGEDVSALPTRILSTPPHYAYLKISEGCDRRCGFCAIPLIRGGHVSVPMEELEAEARELASRGVRELIVIAQDTTYYGMDIYGERRLGELLRRLARIEGIGWIRLHYAYPAGFPQDVIEAMRDEPKICKYLDIPLQHISDGQLRAMKRGLGGEGTRELVRKLRSEFSADRESGQPARLALRTTMLVGYPGETEADFEELMDFVREVRFERLGVFPYSEEEGTYSAEKLSDDVPGEVKQKRAERLMELQAEISAENNTARIGSTMRVIVDRCEAMPTRESSGHDRNTQTRSGLWICRSEHDSPEVDNEILVRSDKDLAPGSFVTVKITGAGPYDLEGEVIAEKI